MIDQQTNNELPPFISVIMPVRNEGAVIADVLRRLVDQSYPMERFEIIVVDGISSDNTREIVSEIREHSGCIRLLGNPFIWSSAARNIGIRAAKGDHVVIVDGHCEIPDDQFLQNLADAFRTSNADVIGRPQPLSISNATFIQKTIAYARSSWLGHHPDSYIYSEGEQFAPAISMGAAYRRSVFDKIGFFDESFDACEDVDLNHRADMAGLRCFFSGKTKVNYHPRRSLCGLFSQLTRYGRGRIRLFRKHGNVGSLKSMVPAIFVAGLIVGPFASLFHPMLMQAFGATMLFYFALVMLATINKCVEARDWSCCLLIPVVILTIHISSGWGMLCELLFGNSAQPAFVSGDASEFESDDSFDECMANQR